MTALETIPPAFCSIDGYASEIPPGFIDATDYAVHCWAERVLARTILYIDGEMDLQTAVDGAWRTAESAGLVDLYGADEIQASIALAFQNVRGDQCRA